MGVKCRVHYLVFTTDDEVEIFLLCTCWYLSTSGARSAMGVAREAIWEAVRGLGVEEHCTGPSLTARDSSSTTRGFPSILVPSRRRSARRRQTGTSKRCTQTFDSTVEALRCWCGSTNRTDTLLTGSAILPAFLHRFLHSVRLAFVGQTTEKPVSLM
jgi:hypothetical protein